MKQVGMMLVSVIINLAWLALGEWIKPDGGEINDLEILLNQGKAWTSARKRCMKRGRDLVIIKTSDANARVYELAKKCTVADTSSVGVMLLEDDNLVSVDGEDSSYNNWGTGEPSQPSATHPFVMMDNKQDGGVWSNNASSGCAVCGKPGESWGVAEDYHRFWAMMCEDGVRNTVPVMAGEDECWTKCTEADDCNAISWGTNDSDCGVWKPCRRLKSADIKQNRIVRMKKLDFDVVDGVECEESLNGQKNNVNGILWCQKLCLDAPLCGAAEYHFSTKKCIFKESCRNTKENINVTTAFKAGGAVTRPPTQAPSQPTQVSPQPTQAPSLPSQGPPQPTQASPQPTPAPPLPTQVPPQPTVGPGGSGATTGAGGSETSGDNLSTILIVLGAVGSLLIIGVIIVAVLKSRKKEEPEESMSTSRTTDTSITP